VLQFMDLFSDHGVDVCDPSMWLLTCYVMLHHTSLLNDFVHTGISVPLLNHEAHQLPLGHMEGMLKRGTSIQSL
jgi:hypothetical protein